MQAGTVRMSGSFDPSRKAFGALSLIKPLAVGIGGIGFKSHRLRSTIHVMIGIPICLRHYILSLIITALGLSRALSANNSETVTPNNLM